MEDRLRADREKGRKVKRWRSVSELKEIAKGR